MAPFEAIQFLEHFCGGARIKTLFIEAHRFFFHLVYLLLLEY
jgi:hypothetical protein